jgi:hypothetical protein
MYYQNLGYEMQYRNSPELMGKFGVGIGKTFKNFLTKTVVGKVITAPIRYSPPGMIAEYQIKRFQKMSPAGKKQFLKTWGTVGKVATAGIVGGPVGLVAYGLTHPSAKKKKSTQVPATSTPTVQAPLPVPGAYSPVPGNGTPGTYDLPQSMSPESGIPGIETMPVEETGSKLPAWLIPAGMGLLMLL